MAYINVSNTRNTESEKMTSWKKICHMFSENAVNSIKFSYVLPFCRAVLCYAVFF